MRFLSHLRHAYKATHLSYPKKNALSYASVAVNWERFHTRYYGSKAPGKRNDEEAFQDALAVLSLLKDNGPQVQLFSDVCTKLKLEDRAGGGTGGGGGGGGGRTVSTTAVARASRLAPEKPFVRGNPQIWTAFKPESEPKVWIREKKPVKTIKERKPPPNKMVKEKPAQPSPTPSVSLTTKTDGKESPEDSFGLPIPIANEMKKIPVSGMQLSLEMDMTNVKDALLNPSKATKFKLKPKKPADSRVALSTKVRVDSKDTATIPLDFQAMIHGTVDVNLKELSEDKLKNLKIPEFNEYVTAIAANLCSTALQKGFPTDVNRKLYSTKECDGDVEENVEKLLKRYDKPEKKKKPEPLNFEPTEDDDAVIKLFERYDEAKSNRFSASRAGSDHTQSLGMTTITLSEKTLAKPRNRSPNVVCVREGDKGCTSPGLAGNKPFVPKGGGGGGGGQASAKASTASLGLLDCKVYKDSLKEAQTRRKKIADAQKPKAKSSSSKCGAKKSGSSSKCGAKKSRSSSKCGAKKSSSSSKCGAKKSGSASKCGAKKSGSATKCGAKKSGSSTKCGAKKSASSTKCGAKKSASSTKCGAKKSASSTKCGAKKSSSKSKCGAKKSASSSSCGCSKSSSKGGGSKCGKKSSSASKCGAKKSGSSTKCGAKKSSSSTKCGAKKSGSSTKCGAKKSGSSTKCGAKKSGSSTKCGAKKSSSSTKCGAKKSGSSTKCGAKKSASSTKCGAKKSSSSTKCGAKKSASSTKCGAKKSASSTKCGAKKSASSTKCGAKKSASSTKCGAKKSSSKSKCGAKKSASSSSCGCSKSSSKSGGSKCGKKSSSASKCGAKKSGSSTKCGAKKSSSSTKCGAKKSSSSTKCGAKKPSAKSKCGPPAKSKCAAKKSASTSTCGAKKSSSKSKCGAKKSSSDSKCGAKKSVSSSSCGSKGGGSKCGSKPSALIKCGQEEPRSPKPKCGSKSKSKSKSSCKKSSSASSCGSKSSKGSKCGSKTKSKCGSKVKSRGASPDSKSACKRAAKSTCGKKGKSSSDSKVSNKGKPKLKCGRPARGDTRPKCKKSSSSSSKSGKGCKKSSSSSKKNPGKKSSSTSTLIRSCSAPALGSFASKSPCRTHSRPKATTTGQSSQNAANNLDLNRKSSSASSFESSKLTSSVSSIGSKPSKSHIPRTGASALDAWSTRRGIHTLATLPTTFTVKLNTPSCYILVRDFSSKCKKGSKGPYMSKRSDEYRRETCDKFSWRDTIKHRKKRKEKPKNCYPDDMGEFCPSSSCYRIMQKNRKKKPKENEIVNDKALCTVKLLAVNNRPLLLPANLCNHQQVCHQSSTTNQEGVIQAPYQVCTGCPSKPEPKNKEVLVRVEAVSLSDSDIHMFETGGKKYSEITLGNEAAGVVEQVSKDVTHLKPGDHVVMETGLPCGKCNLCLTGHYNICNHMTFTGCLRKFCSHPATFCHKINSQVPLEHAALVYQMALGCNACSKARIKPNSKVAVIGSCTTTLCAAMCAQAMGAHNVCVLSSMEFTEDVVREFVTDKVVCIESTEKELKTVETMKCLLGGLPDIVINCASCTKTMNTAIMALKPSGVCVIAGFLSECASFNLMDALMKEIHLVQSFRSKNMFPMAINILECGKAPIDCILANCCRWDAMQSAFKSALSEANIGPRRVVIQCQIGDASGQPKKKK